MSTRFTRRQLLLLSGSLAALAGCPDNISIDAKESPTGTRSSPSPDQPAVSDGRDGVLIIQSGVSHTITSDNAESYRAVTIHDGGALHFESNGTLQLHSPPS
jgi:hypothetical protein